MLHEVSAAGTATVSLLNTNDDTLEIRREQQ